MGTHGVTAFLRTGRAVILTLACAAAALLLPCAGDSRPLLAQDSGILELTYELLSDDEGNVTGIVIKGAGVPEKRRGGRTLVYLYYVDRPGVDGGEISAGGRKEKINPDGTFEARFDFSKRGRIANEGTWRAEVKIPGDPEIRQVINPILVGTEAGKARQYAVLSQPKARILETYAEVHDEFLAHGKALKALGLDGDAFRIESEGLKPHIVEFLLLAYSADGAETAKTGLTAAGLKHVSCETAIMDLWPFGISPRAAGSPPEFAPYSPRADTTGRVRVAAETPLARIIESLCVTYHKIYENADAVVQAKNADAAISDLMSEKVDMAVIRRPLTNAEALVFVKTRGYAPGVVRLAEGESIAVIVHKSNPLAELSPQQIDAVFSKTRLAGYREDITTWGQLGVKDKRWESRPISAVVPPADSPAMRVLKETVMRGGDLKPGLNEQVDAAGVIRRVAKDPLAIGLCPVRNLRSTVRAVAVSTRNKPVSPTAATIASGRYPLTSYAYICVALDSGWSEWENKRLNEVLDAQRHARNTRRKIVVDTTKHLDEHFKIIWLLLNQLSESVEYDLMGPDRLCEMYIQQEVEKLMDAEDASNETDARKQVEARLKSEYGGLGGFKEFIRRKVASHLEKTQKDFAENVAFLRAQLAREVDITVVHLYEDLMTLHRYDWELCNAYQASLENFNPNGWQVVWQDRVSAVKDAASKYVQEGDARNIARKYRDKKIDKQMETVVSELLNLRLAFLKKLYEKHNTPQADREEIPRNIDKTDHALVVKKAYEVLRQIVKHEVDLHIPPLKESFELLEGKFNLVREYMAPFMPDAPGRRKPNARELEKWLEENFYRELRLEPDKAYKRFTGKDFQDLFPGAARLYVSALNKMFLLGGHYYSTVTLGDDRKKVRDGELKKVEILTAALDRMTNTLRSMFEDKYDVEDKQIYTPEEDAYRERYAPADTE